MNEVGAGAGGGTTENESEEMLRTRPNTIKRSTPTGEYAVRGARIECNCGDGFDVVNIPLCHGVYSGEHPLVSVKDMKVRENICNGFGTCITPEGEKYDCMKEIRVDHEWINENKVRFHIDGEEVLATGAITMCSKHGGGIRVVESGQDGKYVTQSTDEVNVAEKRNMMKNLGEGVDSIKDMPEIPAAILVGLTTIDACEAKIKELGQMWSEADGNSTLQEYYHRQANQIREHILVLGKTAPVSEEYLASIKSQFGSVDGSDLIEKVTTVEEKYLGIEVNQIRNELKTVYKKKSNLTLEGGNGNLYPAHYGYLKNGTSYLVVDDEYLDEWYNSFKPTLYEASTCFHFEIRDSLNTPHPSYEEVNDPDSEWQLLPQPLSIFHDNGMGKPELKYINLDGREAVFDGDSHEQITDSKYYGTYNYVTIIEKPNDNSDVIGWVEYGGKMIGHGLFDVVPYYLTGQKNDRKDEFIFPWEKR